MEGLRLVHAAFCAAGGRAYLVGGAVRNRLLGLPCADTDLAGTLSPEDAVRAFCGIPGGGARIVQRTLGTVHACVGGLEIEYTPFRAESYAGGHVPCAVRFGVGMREDALRRDFTVNALYQALDCGDVIDPLGGLADLSARLLRAARPVPAQTLRDDGLRLLRLCRFAAELGFSAEEGTLAAAAAHAHLLAEISPERRLQELTRLLLADARYPGGRGGTAAGLALARDIGLLAYLLPSARTFVPFARFAGLPDSLPVRLAALCPDAPALAADLAALRASRRLIQDAAERAELSAPKLYAAGERSVRALRCAHGDEALLDALALLRASGRLSAGRFARLQAAVRDLSARCVPRSERDLAVRPQELMALGLQGPALGRALTRLLRHVRAHEQDNERERLLALARPSRCKPRRRGASWQ